MTKYKGIEYFIDARNIEPTTSQVVETRRSREDDTEQLIRVITNGKHFVTLNDTKNILFYQDGVYVYGGEQQIEMDAEDFKPQITSHQVHEIQDHIRRRTYVGRSYFDKDPNMLNLRNGLLDLQTGQIMDRPEYLTMTQIPVSYNPNAKCPQIMKFFLEVLHPKDITTILGLLTLAVRGETKYDKAFVFHGSGKNGKTTLIKLITEFIGEKNKSTISLQQLESDKFASAELFGKLLNINDDLSQKPIVQTGLFKSIVSGHTITAQKKFGQPFEFKPKSIMCFSANKLPESEDDSEGFYRRWVIIPFPNTFDTTDADPDLLEKLTTPEELSGLLNLVVRYSVWLEKTGKVPWSNKNMEQLRKEYVGNSNSVRVFADYCVSKETGSYIEKSELHDAYSKYCAANNLSSLRFESFCKKIKELGFEDERLSTGARPRVWKNCKLIDFKKINDDNQQTL